MLWTHTHTHTRKQTHINRHTHAETQSTAHWFQYDKEEDEELQEDKGETEDHMKGWKGLTHANWFLTKVRSEPRPNLSARRFSPVQMPPAVKIDISTYHPDCQHTTIKTTTCRHNSNRSALKKKNTKQNKGLGRCGWASAGLCKKRQYDPSHWSRPIPDLINKVSVGAITNTVWTLTRH